jgi:hypothetical protein
MKKRHVSKPAPHAPLAGGRKARRCLMCRNAFDSEWVGERICRRCKDTSAWREGDATSRNRSFAA